MSIKKIIILLLLFPLADCLAAAGDLSHSNTRGERVDLSAWHHQYRQRCYFPEGANPQTSDTREIQRILTELEKAPFFASYLLDKARYLNTAFCIEDRADGARGYYDYKYNIITVRKSLPLPLKVIIFMHELRHVDHVSRGYCQSLGYSAGEMARLTFAIEADVNAVTALYAWRLRENGFQQIWDALFELPRYADIFRAFEQQINAGTDEATATLAAFVQWYSSPWRVKGYYRRCLSGYLDLLDESKQIERYRKLPDNYFDDLCRLPDGTNYGCHLTREIRHLPGP